MPWAYVNATASTVEVPAVHSLPSLRSGQPVHERAMPAADGRAQYPMLTVALGLRMGAMESFFSTLKTERTAAKVYRSRDAARADVFDDIERF
jgi:transposase InsO family protein